MVSKVTGHFRGISPGFKEGHHICLILRPVRVELEEDQGLHGNDRNFSRSRGHKVFSEGRVRWRDREKVNDPDLDEVTKLISVDQQR